MIRRPSDKLLKDMSNDELTAESEWHFAEAERILAEVRNLRAQAVAVGDIQSRRSTFWKRPPNWNARPRPTGTSHEWSSRPVGRVIRSRSKQLERARLRSLSPIVNHFL